MQDTRISGRRLSRESRPGAEPIFLGVRGESDAELSELSTNLDGRRVTRWLHGKGLLLAERQSEQAEPDALERTTQMALRLGQLAHVDERVQVLSPPARRPGRRTARGTAVPAPAGCRHRDPRGRWPLAGGEAEHEAMAIRSAMRCAAMAIGAPTPAATRAIARARMRSK
jgi:hypothetical protein